jgi:hypothetical protein
MAALDIMKLRRDIPRVIEFDMFFPIGCGDVDPVVAGLETDLRWRKVNHRLTGPTT